MRVRKLASGNASLPVGIRLTQQSRKDVRQLPERRGYGKQGCARPDGFPSVGAKRYIWPMSPGIAEIQSTVRDVLRRRGVVRASVFGSVARGEATASSDVDFLVEFEPGRSLVDLAGLRLDLAELLDRDVDVATRGSLHPALRERILKELVPIL